MGEVSRYVDTDVSGGAGTGVDLANAYSSMNAWEAAEQTDLVTDGDWHHLFCASTAGTADTIAVTLDGWTTGAANYILIDTYTDNESLKTGWSTSRYRLSVTDAHVLQVKENYTRVTNIQMEAIYSAVNFRVILNASSLASAGNDIRWYNCRIRTSGGSYHGCNISDADTELQMWNMIVGPTSGNGLIIDCNNTAIYNSIVENTGSAGIELDSGDWNIKNVAVFNTSNDFKIDTGGSVTIDYCASDDGDGTNPVSPSGADWDNEYVDNATGNLTLVPSGNCEGGGVDNPGSGLYSNGMDGRAYTSTWSIGVDAKVSATGAIINLLQGPNLGSDLYNGSLS